MKKKTMLSQNSYLPLTNWSWLNLGSAYASKVHQIGSEGDNPYLSLLTRFPWGSDEIRDMKNAFKDKAAYSSDIILLCLSS